MKSLTKLVALGAVLAASTTFALADPISGSVGVDAASGTTDQFTQTSITFDPTRKGGQVNSVTGDFTSYITKGDSVNLKDLTFGTSGTVLLNDPGSFTYTVLSSTVQSYSANNYITVTGTGDFAIGGTTELGSFTLQSSENGTTSLNITANTTGAAVTPEPNSLILMGTGLFGAAGLMFMRRRNATGLV